MAKAQLSSPSGSTGQKDDPLDLISPQCRIYGEESLVAAEDLLAGALVGGAEADQQPGLLVLQLLL